LQQSKMFSCLTALSSVEAQKAV